jgi:hypothetical protein
LRFNAFEVPGTEYCPLLQVQGTTHLERGQNFEAMLENMSGGMPSTQTIDYVEGVSHDGDAMILSDEAIDKVR